MKTFILFWQINQTYNEKCLYFRGRKDWTTCLHGSCDGLFLAHYADVLNKLQMCKLTL